jgi:hypothetical protein
MDPPFGTTTRECQLQGAKVLLQWCETTLEGKGAGEARPGFTDRDRPHLRFLGMRAIVRLRTDAD